MWPGFDSCPAPYVGFLLPEGPALFKLQFGLDIGSALKPAKADMYDFSKYYNIFIYRNRVLLLSSGKGGF